MPDFKLQSPFKPQGSQPQAIKELVEGLKNNKHYQTLLGATGTGKTFTIAHVIEQYKRPTLVFAHNKTLAAQLYAELKELFPNNRVEYFVSYYDYYQPESYIPQTDQYIEKDSQVNAKLEQMRLSATASLMNREDTIIVASVSCIYGLGDPKNYQKLGFDLEVNQNITRKEIIKKLVAIQYQRNDIELEPGKFRVKGDTIDIIPANYENIIRVELFGDVIDRISELHKTTNETIDTFSYYPIFPATHFVIPESEMEKAISSIQEELENNLPGLGMIEAHRLKQRTEYDIEMLRETGFCKGIENYSLHFEGRKKGERPFCLLDYFPKDFLIIIDESHQTLPQIRGMHRGDRSRKSNLVEYGFRLETAFDNRPLNFEEFESFLKEEKVIFVSATPGEYELEYSGKPVEQIIRPTGLVDPEIEVRPSPGQMQDLMQEIKQATKEKKRTLVTTITKKLAEELAEYLSTQGIKTRYLHSEIDTLERTEIIRQLRLGLYDVLVGINLLREGIDIPEVGLIGILDADKEGFLRDTRSLIQITGRAARNVDSKVIMYADKMTDSMKAAIEETSRRRDIQIAYNKEHSITPKQISKPIPEKPAAKIRDIKHIPKNEVLTVLADLEKEMKQAANDFDFEKAILLRDQLVQLKKKAKKEGIE